MTRTAEQHRAETDAWRATAPKDDSKIFPRVRTTPSTRHRDLSQLSALLAFRNRPTGAAEDAPIQPTPTISSNWRLTPANDNKAPDDGYDTEKDLEFVPSEGEMERSFAEVVATHRAEPQMLDGGRHEHQRSKREVHAVPIDGDFERNNAGQVIRIGPLRFSDGKQTEPGFKLEMGKAVPCRVLLPSGAMLHTLEKRPRDKGAVEDTAGSNAHFRLYVEGKEAEPRKLVRRKQERVVMTKEDARKMLAEAIANTIVMPTVKTYEDGFPARPTALRRLFMGMQKEKKGETGELQWQDIHSAAEDRTKWNAAVAAMADDHFRTVTEAMSAKSLREIGEARGYHGQYAIEAGRRLLVAANDNLKKALELAEQGMANAA